MESISIETSTILGDAESMDAFISEVRRGLMSKRKSLAPWLFYDDSGSALFEEITALPEYYVSRLERKILRDNVKSILGQVLTQPNAPVRIIELGAGSAEKTSILLYTSSSVRALLEDTGFRFIVSGRTKVGGMRSPLRVQAGATDWAIAMHVARPIQDRER